MMARADCERHLNLASFKARIGPSGRQELWSNTYPAVIAWSRTADPNLGDYGEPEVLVSFGPVPDIE